MGLNPALAGVRACPCDERSSASERKETVVELDALLSPSSSSWGRGNEGGDLFDHALSFRAADEEEGVGMLRVARREERVASRMRILRKEYVEGMEPARAGNFSSRTRRDVGVTAASTETTGASTKCDRAELSALGDVHSNPKLLRLGRRSRAPQAAWVGASSAARLDSGRIPQALRAFRIRRGMG
jgi:hypothetical protein